MTTEEIQERVAKSFCIIEKEDSCERVKAKKMLHQAYVLGAVEQLYIDTIVVTNFLETALNEGDIDCKDIEILIKKLRKVMEE